GRRRRPSQAAGWRTHAASVQGKRRNQSGWVYHTTRCPLSKPVRGRRGGRENLHFCQVMNSAPTAPTPITLCKTRVFCRKYTALVRLGAETANRVFLRAEIQQHRYCSDVAPHAVLSRLAGFDARYELPVGLGAGPAEAAQAKSA